VHTHVLYVIRVQPDLVDILAFRYVVHFLFYLVLEIGFFFVRHNVGCFFISLYLGFKPHVRVCDHL
jgi:hypothetical protein